VGVCAGQLILVGGFKKMLESNDALWLENHEGILSNQKRKTKSSKLKKTNHQ
jgi:hypothetical protein